MTRSLVFIPFVFQFELTLRETDGIPYHNTGIPSILFVPLLYGILKMLKESSLKSAIFLLNISYVDIYIHY